MSMAIPRGPVSSDSLIVILNRERAGAFLVRSVQIVSGDMRTSHCFTSGRAIEETFVPEFARNVLAIVEPAASCTKQLDDSGFSFALPGIEISGYRINPQPEGLPTERIRLLFRRYVGDVARIFEFEQSMAVPPATVRERIAVDVLRDIISPIFDMLSLASSSPSNVMELHSAAIQARLDRMMAQQQEIEFYTGMLKRYVAGCQHDAAELSRTMEDASSTIAQRRALQ
jgi:hypothetical protein